MAVTIDDARALAAGLPRSHEVFVGGRVKFRVERIVYLVVRLEAIDEDELRQQAARSG